MAAERKDGTNKAGKGWHMNIIQSAWTEVKVSVWLAKWPCVLNPSSTSVTKPVTTNAASLSLFDQTLAHSVLHMSAGWHMILIGHYCGEGVWSPRQKCLNSACETWAGPQGHFSLGGESKTDKHKQQEFQFWPGPSGTIPPWRTHQTGLSVSLAPVRPDLIPDRSWEKLTPLHQTHPHSTLSTNWVTGDQFVFPHNAQPHREKLCKY